MFWDIGLQAGIVDKSSTSAFGGKRKRIASVSTLKSKKYDIKVLKGEPSSY